MIETKDKIINGKEYQVTQFPAMYGLRLAVKIVKTLGPGIARLADTKGGGSILDMDTSNIDIASMVDGLMSSLDDKNTPAMILELFSSTHRERVLLNEKEFDNAFAGNYVELAKALMFIIEVNYGDFFGVLAAGQSLTGNPPSSVQTEK